MNLLKELLYKNKILKIISVLIGLATWSLLSHYQHTHRWLEVPVYFYNVPENMKVTCNQETIRVQLRGKIADLQGCNDLGLHINATDFKKGVTRIAPSSEQLFLPTSVILVHHKPLYLEITTRQM